MGPASPLKDSMGMESEAMLAFPCSAYCYDPFFFLIKLMLGIPEKVILQKNSIFWHSLYLLYLGTHLNHSSTTFHFVSGVRSYLILLFLCYVYYLKIL